jgi:hypothetical protein
MSSGAYSGQLELRPWNLLATRQGRGGAGSAARLAEPRCAAACSEGRQQLPCSYTLGKGPRCEAWPSLQVARKRRAENDELASLVVRRRTSMGNKRKTRGPVIRCRIF